jgi:polyphenol oxidase
MMVMPVPLPKPNDGFHWTQLAGRAVLVCNALEPFADHFFTTRAWPLGERTSESSNGWLDVAVAARVGIEHVGRLQQVHGADAVTYKKGEAPPAGAMPRADIVLTDDPAVAVAVQTADCLAVLIADCRTGAVAAAHAGWRGLAAGVPGVAVNRMSTDFGSRARDLVVAAGPAIGACCYEVGEDVPAQFADDGFSPAQLERWFSRQPSALSPANPPMVSLPAVRRPGHWFFDAWSCVRDQLKDAGVPGAQVAVADLCTASHDAAFCSYRRDGAAAGRMAAAIRTKKLEVRS